MYNCKGYIHCPSLIDQAKNVLLSSRYGFAYSCSRLLCKVYSNNIYIQTTSNLGALIGYIYVLAQYRIAGNFRGRKLSRIVGEQEIREENFRGFAWYHQIGVGVAVDFRGENFRG